VAAFDKPYCKWSEDVGYQVILSQHYLILAISDFFVIHYIEQICNKLQWKRVKIV